MTSAASSSDFATPIFIWIWKAESTRSRSPTISHIAIETPRDLMSYWQSHVPSSHCKMTGPHFHDSPEVDQELLSNHVLQKITLTGLDVEKIQEAFSRFRNNPERWGALGWGIFRRPYERNSTGLSLYLLDKGGIFTYTDYNRGNLFSSSLEIVAITALIFSVAGFLSYWEPPSPFDSLRLSMQKNLPRQVIGPNQKRPYSHLEAIASTAQINTGITESIRLSTRRSFGITLGSVALKCLHDRFAVRAFEAKEVEFILSDAQDEMERRAISGAYKVKASQRQRGFAMVFIAICGINSCLLWVSRKRNNEITRFLR